MIHEETTFENIWRKIAVEIKEAGRSWGTIERSARDRPVWMNFVAALETGMSVQTTKRVSLCFYMQMTAASYELNKCSPIMYSVSRLPMGYSVYCTDLTGVEISLFNDE